MLVMRHGAAVLGAAAITFGLFYFMQLLVASGKLALTKSRPPIGFTIGPVDAAPKPVPRRPPPKQERVKPPPDTPHIKPIATGDPNGIPVHNGPIAIPGPDGGGINPGLVQDGDYMPIVRVQPRYPVRAQSLGIGGYVIVELTVTANGSTRDIRVVEAKPAGIFEKAAIRAAAKFKYKPRVIGGNAVPVQGVMYQFTFQVDK